MKASQYYIVTGSDHFGRFFKIELLVLGNTEYSRPQAIKYHIPLVPELSVIELQPLVFSPLYSMVRGGF